MCVFVYVCVQAGQTVTGCAILGQFVLSYWDAPSHFSELLGFCISKQRTQAKKKTLFFNISSFSLCVIE